MSMDGPLRSHAGPGLSGLLGRNALPIFTFFLYFRRVWHQGSGSRCSCTTQHPLLLLLKIGRRNVGLWRRFTICGLHSILRGRSSAIRIGFRTSASASAIG
jgi:hypothetical protein